MVMMNVPNEVDSQIFGRLLRIAMIWKELDAESIALRLYDEGYTGHKGGPVDPQTVRNWMRGGLSDPGLTLINHLAKILGFPRSYFFDPNPFKYENFRRGPVARQSDYRAPVEQLRDTKPLAYGEPGGIRTLDTRIKSQRPHVKNHNTTKLQPLNTPAQQDYSMTAQDLAFTL